MKTRIFWYTLFVTLITFQYFYLEDHTAAFIESLFLFPLIVASEYVVLLQDKINELSEKQIESLKKIVGYQRSSLKISEEQIRLLTKKIENGVDQFFIQQAT